MSGEPPLSPQEFARASARAYGARPKIVHGDTEALLEMHGAAAVIAFRGTTFNFSDILSDLRFAPTWSKDLGWMHRGLHDGAAAIWPRLEMALRGRAADPAQIWFTGHSKGGAEATVAAALAAKTFGVIGGVVTFGSPRVGFSLGKHFAGRVSHRFVNGNDPVPRHPWPLWGFRHIERLQHCGPAADDQVVEFPDHRIANYIASLEGSPWSDFPPSSA